VDDGKDILNPFSFIRRIASVENHEFAVFWLREPLDEVKTQPDESVLAVDQNFSDVCKQNLSQKGWKSFALVVES
jgi:hypothetical protein